MASNTPANSIYSDAFAMDTDISEMVAEISDIAAEPFNPMAMAIASLAMFVGTTSIGIKAHTIVFGPTTIESHTNTLMVNPCQWNLQ